MVLIHAISCSTTISYRSNIIPLMRVSVTLCSTALKNATRVQATSMGSAFMPTFIRATCSSRENGYTLLISTTRGTGLSGDQDEQRPQLDALLSGYSEFRRFDARELNLIEALRSLRIMHYAAWIARRWDDPAFKIAFPWFDSHRYWEDHVLALREQVALMQEAPIEWREG